MTIGSTGTIRCFPPLPMTRSNSWPGTGISAQFKLKASEILKPHPYRITNTARSRVATHGAGPFVLAADSSSITAASDKGLGTPCPNFGERTFDIAWLAITPVRLRYEKNPRMAESARAREALDKPPDLRYAMYARKSELARLERSSILTLLPKWLERN